MIVRTDTWLNCLLWFATLAFSLSAHAAEPAGWPRNIDASGMKIEVFQPQVDDWRDTRLQAHAAMAVTFKGDKQPTYGVLTLDSTTLVDRTARTVKLNRIERLEAHFPSAPEREAAFIAQARTALLRDISVISLDRLEAAVALTQAERKGQSQPVKNDPPSIIFSTEPAILVYVDGTPYWQDVQGTPLVRAINTRVLLLRDKAQRYYLHFLDGYLTASTLEGPWTVAPSAPAGAKTAEAAARDSKQVDFLAGQPDKDGGKTPSLKSLPSNKPPHVYVASTPTELIVTDGQPNYAQLAGTDLLYVTNTTANIFKFMSNQKSYVLVAGRWFESATLQGPWTYVPPANLPGDFARIPDDSAKENVKASVPGTQQSREAVVAAEIPQTARVDRQKTGFTAVVDGTPQLRAIDGTPLSYVFNAADPVIRVDESSWYAVHNGVWFVAARVTGPWAVAASVPAVIYSIPASSPLHYVTYVKIYDVTPTEVVVGYTSGYYGTVITSDGVVVYGTGYAYSPWVGTYWYGPPVTYGVGVSITWTPWGGWAFGFGFGWGWGYAGIGWWYPPAPWWGPYWGGAYYNAYGGVTAWGPGGWAGTTGNIYGRWGNVQSVSRGVAGFDAYTGNQFAGRYGTAYNSHTGTMVAGRQGAVENVYTGNYAYGGRGTAANARTGTVVSGGRVTVGNEGTGNQATINRATVRTPTGSVNMGGVRTDQGAVGHVGNDVYGAKDGQVYRYDASNSDHWQPVDQQQAQQRLQQGQQQLEQRREQGGGLSQDRVQQLNHDQAGRSLGEARTDAFQHNGAQFQRPSGGVNRPLSGMGGFHRPAGGFHFRR
jgi:hypothetical protein